MAFSIKKTGIYIFLCCCMLLFYNCKEEHTSEQPTSTTPVIDSLITSANNKSRTIPERETDLIKASKLVEELDDTAHKVYKLGDIAFLYYILKNQKQYKKITEKTLKLAIVLKDSIRMARSYANKARFFRNKKMDSAYTYFTTAKKIYESVEKNKSNNPEEYAFDYGTTLMDLAKLSKNVKDYHNSEALTIQAIENFKLSGNYSYLPLSYTNFGTIAKYSNRYDDAVAYYLKSLEYAKKVDKEILYTTLSSNNIGTVYKSKGDYKKSAYYYHKALKYVDYLHKRPKKLARLLDNLGYVKFLANKNNDSAFYLLNKAYRIRDSINNTFGLSTSTLHLAEYYQSKGNDSISRVYAKKTQSITKANNNNEELLQSYQLLAKVSTPKQGLKYAQAYIALNDSLTKRDNLYRDKFARIRYESENLQSDNAQKDKTISEVQNRNAVYLLAIGLSLTGIGFIIFFFRQRTRNLRQQNKIVAFQSAYETETRISKRLHDELGNDIYQVMLQYQNNPHDPQITNKLNTAYTRARDISRENSEFEVGETYVDELTDMLTNYSKNNIKLVLRGVDNIPWQNIAENLKITSYRVLQELMTNMQKHSEADLVAIVFKKEKNNLHIKYSDSGVGIDKETMQSKNGLRNTEKRILAIHGTIIFDSSKNNGFKAEISIPIEG